MTFEKILAMLSKDVHICDYKLSNPLNIEEVALIDSRQRPYSPPILYFGYDKQLDPNLELPQHCIIGKTPSTHGFQTLLSQIHNYAYVPEDHLFSLFNETRSLLEHNKNTGLFEELTSIARETHDIESLLNAASIRLGHSLIFCDMNFKILASSSTIPVVDTLWLNNIKQGYCSYDFIRQVKELRDIKKAKMTFEPIEVTCNRSPYRKISCKVFHHNVQVGFLLLIEGENKIGPEHFEMMGTISHILSYSVDFYFQELFEKVDLLQALFYDLLIGAPSHDILPKLSAFEFPEKMVTLFIKPTHYLGHSYLKKLEKRLKLHFHSVHVVHHMNGLVALLPSHSSVTLDAKAYDYLLDLFDKESIKISISNAFSDIKNFQNYFKQALFAMEMGSKFNPDHLRYPYIHYQSYALLSEFEDAKVLGKYCHPALTLLRQYDYDNHSDLYETLSVYLDMGCSIKKTSEALFIHRNSMVYRLKRINEIAQIDLEDTPTLFLLRLSYMIDHYNQ